MVSYIKVLCVVPRYLPHADVAAQDGASGSSSGAPHHHQECMRSANGAGRSRRAVGGGTQGCRGEPYGLTVLCILKSRDI